MTKKERDKRICELYNVDNISYAEIGRKFELTLERVRQIINPEKKNFCEKHNRRYSEKVCPICEIEENYWEYIDSKENLEKEIDKLPNNREQTTVLKRMLIAKKLREQNTKISIISLLLGRHPSSINYLLNVKGKK